MTSLFAANLHPDCDELTLFRKFSPVGKIMNIHIFRKKNSVVGYAYINFEEKKSAEKALTSMNYDVVKGQPIRLMWAKTGVVSFNPNANLFIKNLHTSIDDKCLYDLFAIYGPILSLKVEVNKSEEGELPGVGYVQYEDEKSAEAAVKNLQDKIIYGLPVTVCKFQSKDKRNVTFNNIYLKNIPLDFDDNELSQLCEKFGTIISAKVMKDNKEVSKGFGFVCFKSTDSAKKAVDELNNTFLFGKRLYVGRAKTKKERESEVLENFWRKLKLTEKYIVK